MQRGKVLFFIFNLLRLSPVILRVPFTAKDCGDTSMSELENKVPTWQPREGFGGNCNCEIIRFLQTLTLWSYTAPAQAHKSIKSASTHFSRGFIGVATISRRNKRESATPFCYTGQQCYFIRLDQKSACP